MPKKLDVNKPETYMLFKYHKLNLIWYENWEITILYLSSVLSCFLKLNLHGDPNYDVTPTFSDVTAYAISAPGYSGITSSLVIAIYQAIY